MPKVILHRFWRKPGGPLLSRGTTVEVSDGHADFLVANGAASLVDEADVEDVGPADDGAVETVENELADDDPVEDVESVEVKKPRKTDKLAVWQAYATAIKHPWKGKTREQLISELA